MLLSLLTAFILALSFPIFDFPILAWVAFVPLFFILENNRPRNSFILGFFAGSVFWLAIIYWLKYVTWLGLVLLSVYLAVYFALFSLFTSQILRSKKKGLFLIPAVWVVLEFIRANILSGFGWALLGYSQYKNILIIQFADLIGSFGVSFLVMLVNVFIYLLLKSIVAKNVIISRKQISIVLLVIVLVIAYGIVKLGSKEEYSSYRIGIVQGNIAQDKKWDSALSKEIFSKYSQLTHSAILDEPDLIIWPETALPFYVNLDKDNLKNIKDLLSIFKKPILIGSILFKDNDFYNSALLFNYGELQRYDKIHLVPFGEYIPFREKFPFLEAIVNMVMPIEDLKFGQSYTIFDTGIKLGALICFEDTASYLSRNFVRGGAQLLVNITNDAWFMDSSSPYQHLQASVFRAVENRVPLVRCANTGVSCFINKNGLISSSVKDKQGKMTFSDGYLVKEIKISKNQDLSFYNRYPFILIFLCVFLIVHRFIIYLLDSRIKKGA